MSLLSVTVEKFNTTEPVTPYTKQLSIPQIRLLTSEFYDFSNDRGYLEYWNTQSMIIERYWVTETASALLTTLQGTADSTQNTAMFPNKVVVNKIDRKPFGKFASINTDAKVNQLPESATTATPAKVLYDYGVVNHAKHKELSVCAYPLLINSVDISSTNSVTVNCCVANLITAGASISIVGDETHTYTVVSSTCTSNGDGTQIIVEEALDDSTDVGDTVALT